MKDNLQTIIVSKSSASTRAKAERLAKPHARKIYTSRETSTSWRFRQRPPSDFVKGSFRSFPLPGDPGIVLVYGKLKTQKNPGDQRWLHFRHGYDHGRTMREWDFWMAFQPELKRIRSGAGLKKAVAEVDRRNIQSELISALFVKAIADRARALKVAGGPKTIAGDEQIVRKIREGRIPNPGRIPNKATKKKGKKSAQKAPKHVKLKDPRSTPDTGPCSWLGSIVEFSWVMKPGEKSRDVDDDGNAIWTPNSEWMFMWSPKYKAVVSIRRPKNMYKLAKVERYGGAAKMFEVFMDRPADAMFEVDLPDVKLKKLGKKAANIVYRSDKWSPERKEEDYIHPYGKGVQIYCGPSIQRPEIFLCFGGKLTLTKRGLVW